MNLFRFRKLIQQVGLLDAEPYLVENLQKHNTKLCRFSLWSCLGHCSSTEAVESAALSLKSVDDVESGDGLSLGVLSVGDGVTNNVLEEASEDVSGLLVDEGGDSLDTTAASKSADSRLGDTEDGLLEGLLSVSLGSDLAVALSNFTSSGHLIDFELIYTKF